MGANLCPGQIWHLLCVFTFYQLVVSIMLKPLQWYEDPILLQQYYMKSDKGHIGGFVQLERSPALIQNNQITNFF